jgi:hypothetical protein
MTLIWPPQTATDFGLLWMKLEDTVKGKFAEIAKSECYVCYLT